MDRTNESKIDRVPPILINIPSISIIPTRKRGKSSKIPLKHFPVSAINRVSKAVSYPVTVVPVLNKQDQSTTKITYSKEIGNNFKGNALNRLSNRPEKQDKFSVAKDIKSYKGKLDDHKSPAKISKPNQLMSNQIKKIDSSLKLNNVNITICDSLTSNSGRVNQELMSHQSSKLNITDLNCKVDSTIMDVEKNPVEISRQFNILNNGQFTYKINDNTLIKDTTSNSNTDVDINFAGELFTIKRTVIYHNFVAAMNSILHKSLSKEELETIVQNSSHIKSTEHWSSEIKDVSSTSYKLSPVNHSNISTSKNQVPSQVDLKSQIITATKQQPWTSKQSISPIKISTNTKQTNLSSKSKIQQPIIKQNELKQQYISNNQHPTSMKHPMARVTQSVNKQNQQKQPTPPNNSVVSISQLPPVTSQLIGLSTSIQKVKKCIKCKAMLEDDVCTTCCMSSQLKGVTATQIETPGTQLKYGDNQANGDIIIVISDEDDDEKYCNVGMKTKKIVPVVTKIETKYIIKKHINKLSLNPKLLEDKLWQNNFKDCFKFKHCHTIQIGSFNTKPSGDILICLHGIRMTIQNIDFKSVIIDIQIKNVVKILRYRTTILIYTNYLAAVGIQKLLKMKKSNKICYFDPLSQDNIHKKIIWSFDLKQSDGQQLKKLLLKLPKGKYETLTKTQANQILIESSKEKEKYNNYSVPRNPDDTPIYKDTLDGLQMSTLKISDYKMLEIDEFVNDILIEFYLSYWLMRKLSTEDKNRTYVLNTYFYDTLTKKNDVVTADTKSKNRHDKVKKWTKNVNVFEKDFIFIPINKNHHWLMAVICFPYLSGPVLMENNTPIQIPPFKSEQIVFNSCKSAIEDLDEADVNMEDLWNFKIDYNERIGTNYITDVANLRRNNGPSIKQPCILLFDSLYGGMDRAKIVATLREWLLEEYCVVHNSTKKDFSFSAMLGAVVKVPQQSNSTDCGLFVMHYFEKFFKCPIMDYNFPISHLENWFNTEEVTLNCQKRKEVQSIILEMVAEQGLTLPPGVNLPDIRFTALKSNTHNSQNNHNTSNSPHNNLTIQQCEYQNQNKHNFRHCEDEIDDDDDIIIIDKEEEEKENFKYFENKDTKEYQSKMEYSGNYNHIINECQELYKIPDQKEYYYEMSEGFHSK